jgi:3-deoxy-D-arabino-heptulosonate 7-phosphate (DAHP) synthase
MMNVISQYAKKYEEVVEQLQGIVRMLMRRYIERNERQDDWRLHGELTKKR